MNKLTKLLKSILYCPRCWQRKSWRKIGADVICSNCEQKEKAQCEVF